jgi:hypothetical protein
MTIRIKNKKAISEIVSYVLLIMISLSLAVGVYSFMKFYVPSDKGSEKCPEDIALYAVDSSCENKVISLIIENKGMFNVDGFLIKGANDPDITPTITLNSTDEQLIKKFPSGFQDFNTSDGITLKPGLTTMANFSYADIPQLDSLKRISIQPYIFSDKIQDIVFCDNIITAYLKNC